MKDVRSPITMTRQMQDAEKRGLNSYAYPGQEVAEPKILSYKGGKKITEEVVEHLKNVLEDAGYGKAVRY